MPRRRSPVGRAAQAVAKKRPQSVSKRAVKKYGKTLGGGRSSRKRPSGRTSRGF